MNLGERELSFMWAAISPLGIHRFLCSHDTLREIEISWALKIVVGVHLKSS